MITKLARHYNRELQIAVVTRGVTTINGFEALLREYMNINTRGSNNKQKVGDRPAVNYKRDAPSRQPNNESSKPHIGWRENYQQKEATARSSGEGGKQTTINLSLIHI